MRIVAAALAGLLALAPAVGSAAPPPERAAEPFPEVKVPVEPARSHRAAWVTMAAGAGLIAGSFALHDRANRTYDEYLASTNPDELDDLFHRAEAQDHWSAAALIGGEVLVATGIYLRFLRGPGPAKFAMAVSPAGVAARWRF